MPFSVPELCGIGTLEDMARQRTAEARGENGRVDYYLPPSVEKGNKADITDIDVLAATEYCKTARAEEPHGAEGLSNKSWTLYVRVIFEQRYELNGGQGWN